MHHFKGLARSLSGRWSWAGLGVVFCLSQIIAEVTSGQSGEASRRASSAEVLGSHFGPQRRSRSGILTPSSVLPIVETFAHATNPSHPRFDSA